VSADADPYTGVAVHDSTPGAGCNGTVADPNWCTIGGTSLASPLIAAVFALAGGAGEVAYPARTLYENERSSSSSLHDVTVGSNAACSQPFNEETGLSACSPKEESEASKCVNEAICLAVAGYDGPTGVGTPNGIKAFEPTGKPAEEEPPASPKSGSGGGEEEPIFPTRSAPTGSTPSVPPPVVPVAVQLSALALTVHAIVALNASHPKVSQIGFTFTINAATAVRVTVAKRIHVHHRSRWKTLGRSVSAATVLGRNTWRLAGQGRLSPGRYRITLAPAHAASKSLTFLIG
jgi:hypothetical protein